MREIERWKPDIVLLDVQMPRLTGYEVCQRVKSDVFLRHIPVVMLTGQENKRAATSPDGVIDAYLYKPVKADELTDCLADLLRAARATQDS